ncbi:piggyBac transposable element-derived protein 4-like [Penaeus chinensis]|uniref:piggyBac transposable element-derived protein 4-like n=1 Tax=Penaeus chinensis TaxID=139456 RepID=UPI001FB61AE8|nr:piggyBac transposable element-derived protein 4-like [Penaeus chinensis]
MGAHAREGFMSFTDVGEPQPSTSREPVVAPVPAVPLLGDSDWEDEEEVDEDQVDDPDYFDDGDDADSDCTYDELDREEVTLDYVSAHDTSIDSDEPLSEYAHRHAARNAPGSKGWKGWYKEENVPRRHGFCGTPGLKEELGLEEDSTPREILDCFFPPDLWQTLETQTNLYAEQHPQHQSSHMKAWEDSTAEELQKYIGLRLLMGVQPRPSYRHYWCDNPLLNSSVSRQTMTRDRYDLLTANLHFSDNEDPAAADDRLWKLRPVMDTLQRTFKEVFTPEENIAVDESLWAYRGRHHAVQYNPSKRARFGMKVYKLCSSDGKAAGYTSAFRVYMAQDRSDVPASMKAVVDLMHEAGLFEKGNQLYLDNWYSSPTLFHYLQSRKTETVGTVRLNRKFMPKDLSVKKGEVDIRTSRAGMLAMSWFDKKQVNILSTIHRGDEMVDLPPNRRGEVRRKPLSIVDYNKGMKGVDISDQLAQSYPAARKTTYS